MKKPTKRETPTRKAGKAAGTPVAPPAREKAKEPAAPAAAVPAQAELFVKAAALFHAGRFAEARRQFEAATTGANREMAHSARLHIRMCDQRLAREAPALSTAEDHYNYAIALINRRDYQTARQHLEQALGLAADGDHLHYAMALCLGLFGDLDGACRHLKRAIEIQPRNRALARSDPDFAELLHRPGISELLGIGRGGPS